MDNKSVYPCTLRDEYKRLILGQLLEDNNIKFCLKCYDPYNPYKVECCSLCKIYNTCNAMNDEKLLNYPEIKDLMQQKCIECYNKMLKASDIIKRTNEFCDNSGEFLEAGFRGIIGKIDLLYFKIEELQSQVYEAELTINNLKSQIDK